MKAELIHELVTVDVIATSSAYATRAHIVDLFNQLSTATARAEAAEKELEQLTQLCKATEERERDAITTAAGLRRALEAGKADRWAATVGNTETNAFAPSPWVLMAETALAASPDDHARRIKAEALREFAARLDIEVIGNGDWCAGIAAERAATVDDLRDTADRLEAPNATR